MHPRTPDLGRRGPSGTSLLLLTAVGVAVWAIGASLHQAAQRGFTPYDELDQATRDAIPPVLAWTIVSLPLIWLVGTMTLLALAQRAEVSFPLLLVIFGQFLCLIAWVLPLAPPYGLGMGVGIMWCATRHPLSGRVYRAAIGAVLAFSGLLDAIAWIPVSPPWLALVGYVVGLAVYCALVLVWPAIRHQHK